MIYLIFITSLFAHEDLPSMQCHLDKQSIQIELVKHEEYKIKTPDMKTAKVFKDPTMKDVFDPELKQLFDTYSFKKSGLDLVVKRPETKGPIKSPFALWNQKKFDCKK